MAWFGGCAHFDFTVTDSIIFSILSGVLAHRWVHLSFLGVYYEHFPSLITELHWNTKRGLV